MVLSIGQQLTSEERLERSVFKILTRIPEIAGVLMLGTREVSYDEQHVPTACTNGRDEWYGDKFMKTLNDPAFRFVVIHEVYHKIYRHTVTWRHLYDRRPRLANIACDYVINHQIWQSYGGDGSSLQHSGQRVP
jgi:predicted metal-dependent peptidase